MSQALLDKVIIALDYDSAESAYRLVETLDTQIHWYKIGPMLFTRSGIEVVRFLQKKNKKVFIDLKLHDTPQVVAETVRQFADMGAQYATVHCLGGRAMLEAASRSCRSSALKLVGLSLLTSREPKDAELLGCTLPEKEIISRLVDLALESRLAGIMCSPQEISDVRPRTLPGFKLFTPGIRPNHALCMNDDQRCVATPKQAIEWGSDFLIIGRPITQAREPLKALEELFVG